MPVGVHAMPLLALELAVALPPPVLEALELVSEPVPDPVAEPVPPVPFALEGLPLELHP